MNYPVIVVVHKIEGRIRVKLSHSIVDIEMAEKFMKKDGSVEYVRYNPNIKSLLVKFNPSKISAENVVFKIAMLLSEIYGFSNIKFVSNSNKRDMPLLSYYSIISILGANVAKYLNLTTQVQEFISWLATGTTVGAIVEHGYSEMTQRGTVDPEVMSIMYLINSIEKGNMLNASLVSWITTFGRHILKRTNEEFIIRLEKMQVGCNDELCYDISILPDDMKNKKIDSFRLFMSEIIESQNRCMNPGFKNGQGQGNMNLGNFNRGMFF